MNHQCDECSAGFVARSPRQRFCSDRCRYRFKDRGRMIACSVCGEPMHRGPSVRTDGRQKHNRCPAAAFQAVKEEA